MTDSLVVFVILRGSLTKNLFNSVIIYEFRYYT